VGLEQRAGRGARKQDGLSGQVRHRLFVHQARRDDLVSGGHEELELLDALGGGHPLARGGEQRARARTRQPEIRFGLPAGYDGDGLDPPPRGLFRDAPGQQVLVAATALASRSHESADHHIGDRLVAVEHRRVQGRQPCSADDAPAGPLRIGSLVEAGVRVRRAGTRGQVAVSARLAPRQKLT